MEDYQVRLTISTDYGHTADFLRELASAIENGNETLTSYETSIGCAEVEWPEV